MLRTLIIYAVGISFRIAFSEPNGVPEYVPCEKDWYYFGGKCYKGEGHKEHEKLSWNTALEKCRSYGGDLVSIGSQEEQDFITTFLLLELKAKTFIGLNDIEKEGDYKWSDGDVYNYTNWVPTQPDDTAAHEDCLHLWFDPGNDLLGEWNDMPCSDKERYICEMKSNTSKRSANPVYCSSEAGTGWKWGDSCYHIVTKEETWQNAEKHCKNYYNGHLATALNMLEDEFLGYILGNIKEEVWIGIKVQEQLQQKWSSGWYVSYNGFKKDMHFTDGTCAARKSRKEWMTVPCTNKLPFICKVSKESSPILQSTLKGSHCPVEFDGWRDLGGEYCYYFETKKALNFYEALFDCKRRGGNMISLHSKEEEDVILPFVTYSDIGKHTQSYNRDWYKYWASRTFWIGLVRAWPRDEEFVWTDGSAVKHVKWLANQPDNKKEKCVEVHTHDIGNMYQWNDVRCTETRGYICSIKKITANTPSAEDNGCNTLSEPNDVPEYVPCERGWYYWGEKCYKGGGKKDHQRVTWNTALERCRSYGGDLVSIGSQEEQDFITTFLLFDLKAMTFIGLNDITKEEDYRWTDGTVFNYTNWVPTQPVPGATESEDCVHMWFDPGNDLLGKWNDINCYDKQRFICETKSNPRKRSRNPIYCSSEVGRGWKWENSCYHVVKKKDTWQNAEKYCKSYYNGHLTTALNMLEDEFLGYILGNIKEEIWLGIKIQEPLQQKWSSGWFVSYNGFKKDMHFTEGTCAVRKSRKEWITVPCTNKLPFICKVSTESPPILKPPPRGSHCPVQFDGWRDLGGEYCYYFETEKGVNFYEALFECKRRGGNLASLHSKEEDDVILPFVTYSSIGKRINHDHDWGKYWASRTFWIGLVRSWTREEEFVWTDGSEVNYLNFVANQPDREDEKCVEVHTHDIGYFYQWNDIFCEEKRGYICSVKKILSNPPLTEEEDCDSFCISQGSYLYEVVQQSSDAKLLPKGDITHVN